MQANRPWRLWVDVRITRRKRYHIVENPEGAFVWRDTQIGRAIAWLCREGVSEYDLVSEERAWRVQAEPIRRPKEPPI